MMSGKNHTLQICSLVKFGALCNNLPSSTKLPFWTTQSVTIVSINLINYVFCKLRIILLSSATHMSLSAGVILAQKIPFSISNTIYTSMCFPNKWKNSSAPTLYAHKVSYIISFMVFKNLYPCHLIHGNPFPWNF